MALMMLFAVSGWAQQSRFRLLTADEGLPQSNGIALFQDKLGFMWIGTAAGLARYDGSRFDAYGLDNGLANDYVNDFDQDAAGLLWIATNGGLSSFDGHQFTNYQASEEVMEIRHIKADPNGRIWCGTSMGLLVFDRGSFRQIVGDKGIPQTNVYDLEWDHQGKLWVATQEGLFRQTSSGFRREELFEGSVRALARQGEGMWIAGEHAVVHMLGQQFLDRLDASSGLAFPIKEMCDGADGSIWLAQLNRISTVRSGVITHFTSQNGLPIPDPGAILEDRDGLIWVGGTLGVAYLVGRAFSNFGKSEGLPADGVRSLLWDSQKRLWVGTLMGLIVKESSGWKTYGSEFGLDQAYISALAEGQKGQVMVSTRSGWYLVDQGKVSQHRDISDGLIDGVVQQTDGTFWIGARDIGLFKGRPGSFEKVEIPQQIYKKGMLLRDSVNRIWVSANRGLSVWDGVTWKTYTKDQGLSSNHPYFLMETKNHEILFSYHGAHGFSAFDGTRFRSYSTREGLTHGSIYSILEDHQGSLWIGSANGIDRFDGKRFVNYGPGEGLASRESNSGAAAVGPDGSLWFGTMAGLSQYQPTFDYTERPTPKPIFSHFQLGDQHLDPLTRPEVEANDNELDARIFVPTFIPVHRIEIDYRLLPSQDSWVRLEGSRLMLPKLEPMSYRLEIRARKYGGPYSEVATAEFVVHPHPKDTLWFRSLVLLLLGWVVWMGYRFKLKRYQDHNDKLEALVANRTEELRLEIREHSKAREALENAQQQLVEKAHKAGMAEIMSGVLHNIGNVLSSVGTSATVLQEHLTRSKIQGLTQFNTLLRAHEKDLVGFFNHNPKGKQMIPYLEKLEERLVKEQQSNLDNANRLLEKIDNIKAYITTHQSHMQGGFFTEDSNLVDIVEEALMIQSAALQRDGVTVVRDFQPIPKVRVQKSKLAHIMVNLIKNAREAMVDCPNRQLTIKIETDRLSGVLLEVIDSGIGIESHQMEKIFGHGFTTKSKGYGFGLHSCANYMTEMGGKMWVESGGRNQGACFILFFPKVSDERPQ